MFFQKVILKQLKIEKNNKKWYQILTVLLASITFFISGLHLGWTSPSILKLIQKDSYIPMTLEEVSYFTIIHNLSMVIFCVLLGNLISSIGRKRTILLISVPHFISWMLIGFSVNAEMLYISRVFSGLSDALIFMALPVYIAEISEKHLRGPLACLATISNILGQITMNFIGYYMEIPEAALILSIFPVIFLCLFIWMPQSPYWLIEKQRFEEAMDQIRILRWRSNVDDEFSEIKEAVFHQLSEKGSFKEIFTSQSNRRAFFITVIARIGQQFSGVVAFLSYLQYIFNKAGGNFPSHFSSILCLVFMAAGTVAASKLIEKFGRRPLMILSGIGCTLTLFAEAVYFYMDTQLNMSSFTWLPLTIMLLYIAAFSVGLCIVPLVLVGELFPSNIKPKAVTLVNSVYGLCMMLSGKIFQLFSDYVDISAAFLFFGVTTFCFSFILYYILIETKNKSLVEIQMELKKN